MNNGIPKVSVIFPIYNNEKYLKRCIQSVIDSTLKEIEIILVDDGSTDSAPLIIDEFAEQDDRVKAIHKTNGGSATARNSGLDEATGEYIAFVESDDAIERGMYEHLYTVAKDTDGDIVKCGFYYCTESGREEYTNYYKVAKEGEVFEPKERSRIFQFHPCMWAGIYKRSFIEEHNLRLLVTPKASYTDYSWMMMTYAYAKKVTVVHKPYYLYTYDNPQSSYLKAGELYKPMFYHAKESNRILREAGIFEDVKEDVAIRCYSACIHSAEEVLPKYRKDLFEGLRDVFLDIFCEEFEFIHFNNRKISLLKMVLDNKYEEFYNLLFLEYVFYPFDDFSDKKLVLYGAGKCGKSFEIQLRQNGADIRRWVDRNPISELGVEPVSAISETEYDMILVAVVNKKIYEEIKKQLVNDYGVSEDMIVWRMPFRLV